MPLSLRIDTSEARQSADAFQRILNDIKTAAASIDNLGFTKVTTTLKNLISQFNSVNTAVERLINTLGSLDSTLDGIVNTDYTGRLKAGFDAIRETVQALKGDISGLNAPLRDAVRSTQQAATRPRAQRSTAASRPLTDAETASVFPEVESTVAAITPLLTAFDVANARVGDFGRRSADALAFANNSVVAALKAFGVEALNAIATVENLRASFLNFNPSRPILIAQTATAGLSESFRTAGINADLFSRYVRDLYDNLSRLSSLRSQFSQPLLTPPSQVAIRSSTALARRSSSAVEPFTFEATGGYNRATGEASKTTQIFAGELVNAKSKKDQLDKNLRDTAGVTLPAFYSSLRIVTAALAAFTVRSIIQDIRELGTELFNTGRSIESLEAVFRNATGSTDQAARLFLIAKDRAKELGLDALKTAEELGKLSLAAKGTSLEGEKIERLFRGISAAEAVLVQTTGQAGGLIKVFTDILGKGRLQSEELVKQLGNRLPGSIRVVAEALGKTPQDLAQAVQRGTVQVEEVLVKLGDELARRFGGEAALNVRRLGGAFNNVKTALFELQELVIKGGFSQALIGVFNTLKNFFDDARTRTAVAALGKTIIEVLGAAFTFLIGVLQAARDNLGFVITLFATLTGATVITGIVGLVNAVALLARALFSAAAAGSLLSRANLIVVLAGLAASFIAGSFIAEKFGNSLTEVEAGLKRLMEEQERIKALPPVINNNAPDVTRAYAEALERVQKELRVLSQEVENQIRLFTITQTGVSSLSVAYAAYEKTLQRVRALEKTATFEKFEGQRGESEAIVVRNLFNVAFLEQALEALNKNNRELAKIVADRQILAATFQRASQQFGQGGISELSGQIQQEYESRVIPALTQVRELIDYFTGKDQAVVEALAGAFNEWNRALLANITSIKQLQAELRALGQAGERFRELTTERLINRLRRDTGFLSATSLAPARSALDVGRQAVAAAGNPPTIETFLRSLGPEFERFGKEQADRLGVTVSKFFEQIDPAKTVEQQLKQANEHLANIVRNTASEGGLPATGTVGSVGGTASVLNSPAARAYRSIIESQAARRNIDPELVARLIQQESGFNPNAVSSRGAKGLGQFIDSTARQYNLSNPFDPAESIRATVDYLADLLSKFGGDVKLALAGYNAGPGAVAKYGNTVPPYPETQNFVTKILGGITSYLPRRNLEAVNPILDTVQKIVSSLDRRNYGPDGRTKVPTTPRLAGDYNPEGDLDNAAFTFPRTGVQRIQIDIEKQAQTPVDYLKQFQTEVEKSLKPTQDLNLAIQALTEVSTRGAQATAEVLLSPRAEGDLFLESVRAASQTLQSFGLTQEDITSNSDRFKNALILAGKAASDTYALGLEKAIGAGDKLITQLQDEITAIQIQTKFLNENATTREASLAAELKRQELIKSGIALDQGRGAQALSLVEELRQVQQAQNDLNADPIKRFRDELDQLAKTGGNQLLLNSINSVTDALANLVSTGDYSLNNLRNIFTSVIQNIISEIVKLTIQLYIVKPLLESLSNSGGSSGGSGTGGSDILGLALQIGSVATAASGGIIGRDSFSMRSVPPFAFANASRFQTGGIVGADNVPALLTPGEGVFTAEQMKRLAPAGSGSTSNYNFEININATDGDSVRRTAPQIFGEIYNRLQRSAARDGFVKKRE